MGRKSGALCCIIIEAKSVKSNSTNTIHLSYHGECHYNSVIMIDHIRGDDADADVNGTVEKSERELNDRALGAKHI